MRKLLYVLLSVVLIVCAAGGLADVPYYIHAADCVPIEGHAIVTVSQCTNTAAKISECLHSKVTNDLVNSRISHPEAQKKYEVISKMMDLWQKNCANWVNN